MKTLAMGGGVWAEGSTDLIGWISKQHPNCLW